MSQHFCVGRVVSKRAQSGRLPSTTFSLYALSMPPAMTDWVRVPLLKPPQRSTSSTSFTAMICLAFGTAGPLSAYRPQASSPLCRRHSPITALRRGIVRPRSVPSPGDDAIHAGDTPLSSQADTAKTPSPSLSPSPRSAKAVPRKKRGAALAGPSDDIQHATAEKPREAGGTSDSDPSFGIQGDDTSRGDNDGPKVATIPVRMTGFNTPVVLSKTLSDALTNGERVMTRSQAASYISRYARDNRLGLGGSSRSFRLDPFLRRLFPEAPDVVRVQAITGMLVGHVSRPDACGDPALLARAAELRVQYREAAAKTPGRPKVDRRGHHSAEYQGKMKAQGRGLFAPVRLSEKLSKVCGGALVLTRPEVTKSIWKYIKKLRLQDQVDGRLLHLDPVLKDICDGMSEINCFQLSRYIARHLTPVDAGETKPSADVANAKSTSAR